MASIRIPCTHSAYQSAKEAKFETLSCGNSMMIVLSKNIHALQTWMDTHSISATLEHLEMKPRMKMSAADTTSLIPHSSNTPYFTMSQLRSIYNIPAPSTDPYVVGVISFGGGLYGTVDSHGVLTNGDVQAYWTSIGIAPENHPRVIVVPLFGASNSPDINDGGSTIENTIDIEAVGGACPSSNLTIILYLSPNTLDHFAPMLQYIYSTNVNVNGVNYKPNLISCSWGAPELYYSPIQITSVYSALSALSNTGVSICVATGDNGSNDGMGGNRTYVDFPSSNPYTTAVGGSRLVCLNNTYDSSTVETAWSSGGGGVSSIYAKPDYQSMLTGTQRSIPDVACLADPDTGVYFTINGTSQVIGGTSVAAPTFAGFLAAIHCKTFINPLLYQVASTPSNGAFHDLTSGSNGAYSAHTGYDDCTGWGSFDGVRLANAIRALQAPVQPTTIQVTGINLSSTALTVMVQQTSQVTATVLPNNATTTGISWFSANPLVATVSSTGLITGIRSGTALISARSTDGSNVTSVIIVTVTPLVIIPVSGVTLSQSIITLNAGTNYTLTATITPSNATNPSVTWSSTNPSVATISSAGVITAQSPGSTVIKVTTVSGSFKASCAITVIIPVSNVSLLPNAVSIGIGTIKQLLAVVLPSNATNKSLIWSSSNTNVATVSSTGIVTGRNYGTSTITVQTVDGKYTAISQVTVVTRVQNVRLNTTNLILRRNGTFQAVATISPANALNQNVRWSSSRPTIATVSPTGLITALSPGTATITVFTEVDNLSTFIFVRVSPA